MRIEMHGVNSPGRCYMAYENIHVGVQRGREVVDLHAGDEVTVHWVIEVDTFHNGAGALDMRGPYVHGRPGERFLYLSWGTVNDVGVFTMFRRAKLKFDSIDACTLQRVADDDRVLLCRVSLTDRMGGPLCGTAGAPDVTWSATSRGVK